MRKTVSIPDLLLLLLLFFLRIVTRLVTNQMHLSCGGDNKRQSTPPLLLIYIAFLSLCNANPVTFVLDWRLLAALFARPANYLCRECLKVCALINIIVQRLTAE